MKYTVEKIIHLGLMLLILGGPLTILDWIDAPRIIGMIYVFVVCILACVIIFNNIRNSVQEDLTKFRGQKK